ncbi:MAG: hypothetical protein AAFX76_04585 [Planctomycetota bacterium]
MTRFARPLLAGSVCLSACFFVGCDDEAAQIAKSRDALDEAVKLLEQAEQGFAPGDAEGSYAEYRLQTLAAAEERLQAVAAQGDPVAQAGAHRLLAGVKTSQARATTRDAVDAFARVTGRATALSNHVAAVGRINALIVARSDDGGAVLSALEEGDAMIQQNKAAVTATLAELSAQRESAILEAERLNAQAADHLSRAQQAEQRAFVADSGEAKQEAYTQTYQAQLEAQAARRAAQDQQIAADRLADEIAARRAELAEWDAIAQQVADLRTRVRDEGDAAARDVSTAGSAKQLELATVQEQFEALSSLYGAEVRDRLEDAALSAETAVEQARSAGSKSASGDRQALELERVAAQTELAHVLTRHAGYARDHAQTLAALAASPAVRGSAAARAMTDASTQLNQTAAALVERADGVINDGINVADAMQGDGPVGQAAASLAAALRSYQTRLN